MTCRNKLAPVLLVLTLALTGCQSPAASPQNLNVTTQSGRANYHSEEQKYTKADYELALSMKTEGYREMNLLEFGRKVMNWEDETAYHKREEALERLVSTLPDSDPNYDFICTTLNNTWQECAKKHYNACDKSRDPWYDGWVKAETTGDVFGDNVVLCSGNVDFSFNYSVPDESSLTVGRRDELLETVKTNLADYLKKQSRNALREDKEMKKSLEAELKQLLKKLPNELKWAEDMNLYYYWDEPWYGGSTASADASTGSVVIDSGTAESDWRYTKEQYDLVLKQLKPEGYENMSAGEFARKINAALSYGDDEKTQEKLNLAYEMVLATLPESDPNYHYFHQTVSASQQEYNARVQEVYTEKTVDPEVSCNLSVDITDDVYGDEVVTGSIEGSYSFTYRLLDADRLTVKERDDFISGLQTNIQNYLREASKTAVPDKNALKAEIERLGKTASSDKIQFTGCEISYYEFYQ